jgi:hypothetical protein
MARSHIIENKKCKYAQTQGYPRATISVYLDRIKDKGMVRGLKGVCYWCALYVEEQLNSSKE